MNGRTERDGSARVVVTGVGVVAPNGVGKEAFTEALRAGMSGIRRVPELEENKFRCHVAGIPPEVDAVAEQYFAPDELVAMNRNIRHACIAGLDAWRDAGLAEPSPEEPDLDTGAVVGTGNGGPATLARASKLIDAGKVRRLGSTIIEQTMASSVSAKLAGVLGLGNQVTSNSSACATGTEAVLLAADRIRSGRAARMLAGGSESSSLYTWGAFDAMRVLATSHNDDPAAASRPMSATADGFVPGSGAGVLLLESLESAEARGARVYAEVLGGHVNCGGHRQGGSITAPNPHAVQRCIREAMRDAAVTPDDLDAINGHLTGTMADVREVTSWGRALEASPGGLPWIQSTKSLVGHGLGAAGGIESVACILQLHLGFLHPSLNCEDLHPELEPFDLRIPRECVEPERLDVIAKASFGFGDVNACVVFRRWPGNV